MKKHILLLMFILYQFICHEAFASIIFSDNKTASNDYKYDTNHIPFSTTIIPYQEGFIVLGSEKIKSILNGNSPKGFIEVFHKNESDKQIDNKKILFNFKKIGLLGGILDKSQKNLIFYGYSEAFGLYNHFYIPPEKLKFNSVFIGKYNLESNNFNEIIMLDNNSITTPNNLIMDHLGNYYFLYSLDSSNQNSANHHSAAQIHLRTNMIKLIKLNKNLEKIDEKILEECAICNLTASGLIIDHENNIYSAILKNTASFILKKESLSLWNHSGKISG
ncbi:hypothetical protein [Silvanigrella aquatica]|uniref:Uncharacterized protein n=1 Tax=Silvanigrella aquatica TaxID=1915309 RepID=A0A1L4D1X9_9BACT|nr:hypothetical protein [Silvanigrella aquatica]APJ04215.1 hypothetical protein AXG55_09975 [Silvanigrella aquatica]